MMFDGNDGDYREEAIKNNGFWPDVDLQDFQRSRAIPTDISADFLADALIATLTEVNGELSEVQKQHQADGFATAQDVPGVSRKGRNALCAQYLKAVFARAKADLLGEYTSIVSRAPNPQQESPELRRRLLAESALVIRNMKGLKRATVKTI
ncbi:head completion/stabilization protein [Morganella morganii]|uniref:head completion/stabilization protein n=2 Tax=Morganella morganii TaxID=582 RepID=UPI001F0BB7DF|nr:head completion/stabilization protein [Morganella morganii]